MKAWLHSLARRLWNLLPMTWRGALWRRVESVMRGARALGRRRHRSGPGGGPALSAGVAPRLSFHGTVRRPVYLIISPNEVSLAHGTGVLLSRLVGDRSDVVLMRSRTSYGGHQEPAAVAEFVLPPHVRGRQDVFSLVAHWLTPYDVQAILCVPYFETDPLLAVAAAQITGAPLGLWIMDDNCLVGGRIDTGLMTEAIECASALFAISPELRKAYEARFRRKMWLLPPMVAPQLLRTQPAPPAAPGSEPVVIGNIWSQRWLDRLRSVVRASATQITWFTSNEELSWLTTSADALARDGITVRHGYDTEELVQCVAEAPCVVVPSDDGAAGDRERALGDMSLPTRVPFVVAAAGTPLLVLGRNDTAVARFVDRLGVGAVAAYDPQAFATALGAVREPGYQAAVRRRAAQLASRFSFQGAWDLVFGTIRNGGMLADDRFEQLLPLGPGEFAYYCEPPVPKEVFRDFRELYALCRRLCQMGWRPDWVIDIGASNGIWSYYVADVFPDSRYLLCDPLFSRYGRLFSRPGFTMEEVAVGDHEGSAAFEVAGNLFGSSLISTGEHGGPVDTVEVKVATVDQLAARHRVSGRVLMKVDVQFAEHLVLAGARETLAQMADVVILELTLTAVPDGAKGLLEMLETMDALGFRVFDQVGDWRNPTTGVLEQMDIAFVRKELKLPVVTGQVQHRAEVPTAARG